MYETEANNRREEFTLPAEVATKVRDFRREITRRTLLPWGEHCTECVWPTCYTTCDLYSPRQDGRCRRFVDGMVRVDCPGDKDAYLLKIRFKRWAKLWAPGNIRLVPLSKADQLEHRDQNIGALLQQLPLPAGVRTFASSKRYGWKKRRTIAHVAATGLPDLFVIECFHPGNQPLSLSLTVRATDDRTRVPFQKLIELTPGFQRVSIPAAQIQSVVNLHAPFSVDIIPNDIADDTALYFGLVDFVKTAAKPAGKAEKGPSLKCVVWDLDNTMWSGILVEDGADKLTLKPGIADLIRELDRRGILHSVASKNNFDEAMAVLKKYSLDEYFLHPQISWAPKSEALKAIASKLNIGIDTLMLVDDSEFELAQVQAGCPGVQVLHADRYREIAELPQAKVPVTEESTSRRKMYQQDAVRSGAADSFAGDYLGFLRDCRIELRIEPISPANLERVHELTQRTNQMNFSGNRYERKLLEEISGTPHLDTYVIGCQDRFGTYGIVGFSIVDSREPRMTDLMFSCRIQAKRVEHAFLTYLLKKYRQRKDGDFRANWRKTPRNAPSGQVFADIGMREEETKDGVTSLVFSRELAIPDDEIVQIQEICPKGEAAVVRA